MVETRRPFPESLVIVIFTLVLCQLETCINAENNKKHHCPPSSCGDIHNISYPFRLKDDPKHCGNKRYELSCDNSQTVLHLVSGTHYVRSINYNNYTIRVVDARVFNGMMDNCSFIPHYSLTINSFTIGDPYGTGRILKNWWVFFVNDFRRLSEPLTFLSCANPIKSSSLYMSPPTCKNATNSEGYSYITVGRMNASEMKVSCHISMLAITSWPVKDDEKNISYKDARKMLIYGFELSWAYSCRVDDRYCERICSSLPEYPVKFCGRSTLGLIQSYAVEFIISVLIYLVVFWTATKCVLGTPFVIAFLIYKWRRRHLSMYNNIEDYLQSQNNLNPIRYSFSDIKKMTQRFKHKLGEGGFGSVYRGKLKSGSFVAIKVLSSKSKANGQDFINEIATIGRIHHVNVVQLIGFCVEGSKRALVYDFMPNGSLDKYIFSLEESNPLSIEKMFEISLGIASGIEYLHRGCEKQILHFDIKPHNILLDGNFIPKVSDFGLARLYSADESIVILTAARGTLGYMAPELCYKNLGGVSHKADVYSFGMLLMEMAGKRKNVNNFAEHSSQVFFPLWAYDQFNQGKDIEIEDATEEEIGLTKKMMIVALWCMQMRPSNRPAMKRVVDMLEGELESLQMPPYKPLEFPEEMQSVKDVGNNTAPSCSSIPSDDWSSESVSLFLNSN